MPDICYKCRSDSLRNGRDSVPCEIDGICNYTGRESEEMEVNHKVWLIAQMWLDIIAISAKQKYEKFEKNNAKTVYYFPTLENINIYFKNQNFDLLPFLESEAFYLISVFHTTYIGTIG